MISLGLRNDGTVTTFDCKLILSRGDNFKPMHCHWIVPAQDNDIENLRAELIRLLLAKLSGWEEIPTVLGVTIVLSEVDPTLAVEVLNMICAFGNALTLRSTANERR